MYAVIAEVRRDISVGREGPRPRGPLPKVASASTIVQGHDALRKPGHHKDALEGKSEQSKKKNSGRAELAAEPLRAGDHPLLSPQKDGSQTLVSKTDRIRECIQHSVSEESKKKILKILNEVGQLSDVEKLLLYLQLPTGLPPDVDPLKLKNPGHPLGKKADAEVAQTYTWIQSHLEEDPAVSLPKQEVYEEYRAFCEAHRIEPLCAADFGKVMKHVFPGVKPRRLGTRGNSRYCYSGLRKKVDIDCPSLPDLYINGNDGIAKDSPEHDTEEIISASCHLVFEWAEKLLGEKFLSLKDLACFLVNSMYVDSRSVAAFTVLSSSRRHAEKTGQSSSLLKQASGSRRRETQLHLQRKLQEKELIREQKKKLLEHRSAVSKSQSKSQHNKKNLSVSHRESSVGSSGTTCCSSPPATKPAQGKSSPSHLVKSSPPKTDVSPVSQANYKEAQPNILDLTAGIKTENCDKTPSCHEPPLDTEKALQCSPKGGKEQCLAGPYGYDRCKNNNKVPIPRNASSASVCFSQPVPSIIFVPSLPPVQLQELRSSCQNKAATPKYKRIQPKPAETRNLSVSALCNGNVTSSTPNVVKGEDNSHQEADIGNTSSGAEDLSQSDICCVKAIPENVFLGNSIRNTPNKLSDEPELVIELSSEQGVYAMSDEGNSLTAEPMAPDARSDAFSPMGTIILEAEGCIPPEHSPETNAALPVCFLSPSVKLENLTPDENNFESVAHCAKRPSDEVDNQSLSSKRPHLETIASPGDAVSSGSLSPWSKAELQGILTRCEKGAGKTTQTIPTTCDMEHSKENSIEGYVNDEVSISQLEMDALAEYLQDTRVETIPASHNGGNKSVNLQPANIVQIRELSATDRAINRTANQNAQLSQLRMLLEKNLPQLAMRSSACGSRMANNPVEMIVQMPLKSPGVASQESETDTSGIGHPSEECSELKHVLTGQNKLPGTEGGSLMSSSGFWNSDDERSCSSVVHDQIIVNGMPISSACNVMEVGNTPATESMSVPDDTDLKQPAIPSSFSVLNGGHQPSTITLLLETSTSQSSLPETQVTRQPSLADDSVYTSSYVQVPSVPPSPNTRLRAFSFMPISPRHTPLLEGANPSGTVPSTSPVSFQFSGNGTIGVPVTMVSIAVGPSQPPSAASSPFVSPRSTPLPWSRSRHSSGQSAYSTPRQTPYQNVDSGLSSISSSPFISPQPTPVPISRLRHNSAHSQGKTVTFSASSSLQAMQNQGTFSTHSSRSRHNSGPGGPSQSITTQLLSPRSAPLSPMVGESYGQTSFFFPSVGDTPPLRSRHNSASSVPPLSPLSAPVSPGGNCLPIAQPEPLQIVGNFPSEDAVQLTNQMNPPSPLQNMEPNSPHDSANRAVTLPSLHTWQVTKAATSTGARNSVKWLSGNSRTGTSWPHGRQRHASGSALYGKLSWSTSLGNDSVSQEIQTLLKNVPPTSLGCAAHRSRSVPLHQMLPNLVDQCITPHLTDDSFSKSYPATPVLNQGFNFPCSTPQYSTEEESTPSSSYAGASADHLSRNSPDSERELTSENSHAEWGGLDTGDGLSARRNLTDLLEQPLEDDLQTTLEDLRDCDNDFSKFAQELEQMHGETDSNLT